jgi:hypothetical protein
MRPPLGGEFLTFAFMKNLLLPQGFNYNSHKQLASHPGTGANPGSVPNFDSIGTDGQFPKPRRSG